MSSDDPRRVVIVELAILINGREPLKFDMTQEANLKGGLEVKMDASPRRAPYAHTRRAAPAFAYVNVRVHVRMHVHVYMRSLRDRSKSHRTPVGTDGR